MIIKRFRYNQDRKLTALKAICKQCGSKQLIKTFEYLRILFYFTPPQKVISEYIPDIAYYVCTISKNHLRIIDIGVVKEYQQRGIGKMLINRIIEQAKHLKIDKLTLRTSSNETAFLFYEKLGFITVGIKEEDLEMEKLI